MTVVWKFPLNLSGQDNGKVAVGMPAGARFLHLGLQAGRPTIWAEVDPEREVITRIIQIVATGYSEVPADGQYLGTLQMRPARGGEIVFHFYLLPVGEQEAIMAENMAKIAEFGRTMDRVYSLARIGEREIRDGRHGGGGG